MTKNIIVERMGRRLRLGVIGGGPSSFIGSIHRSAARLDGCFDVVTGVVSSTPDRARSAGETLGFATDRCYGTVEEMLQAECSRADGIDAVAIMTPNDSHYHYAMRSLDHGLDVICDKPMTRTLDEALALHRHVREAGHVFCLTHNYSGYPMVRQAREMVIAGCIGTIRLVQIEYVQGGRAREEAPDMEAPRAWRFKSEKAGDSLVLGDIGTHAHHLLRFVSGLEVAEVCAEVGTAVPNRGFHDMAGGLLRLDNGARGVFWATQAAAGVENSIRFRIAGTLGTLEWSHQLPARLRFHRLDGPSEQRTPNGPKTLPLAERSCRVVAGHPGGFLEAFANIYRDAAEAIAARRTQGTLSPLASHFPSSEDGVRGLQFVDAMLRSNASGGSWVRCPASADGA